MEIHLRILNLLSGGEEFEVNEIYPIYVETAKFQNEKLAKISFTWALKAKEVYAELYREAKKYVDQGKDWPLEGNVWVCPVCDYTHVGLEALGKCPICSASREKVREILA